MKTHRARFLVLACCALLAAAGCQPKAPGISDLQATSGERHLHVRSAGGAWVEPGEDKFTVKLTGHEIVIGKEQILLDKSAVGKVPPEAKRFAVTFAGGALAVTADGVEILKTPLQK